MVDVVLVNPEIPPNTGNVIRLCANTGSRLHLVAPLGFSMSDRLLRRAGLDYHEMACISLHDSWDACRQVLVGRRLFAVSVRGNVAYDEVTYRADDVLVFGAESSGLPRELLEGFNEQQRLRIPMRPGNRSLNLSNAVAVVVFEAWRQSGFAGAATR